MRSKFLLSKSKICHSHSFIADNKIRHVIHVLAACERVYHNDEVSEDGNLDWLVSISLSKDTDAVILTRMVTLRYQQDLHELVGNII